MQSEEKKSQAAQELINICEKVEKHWERISKSVGKDINKAFPLHSRMKSARKNLQFFYKK